MRNISTWIIFFAILNGWTVQILNITSWLTYGRRSNKPLRRQAMPNCSHCNGYVILESGYEHGVYCRQYHCLMCGRYYPVSIVTVQVACEPTKKPPDPFMFHSHNCKYCGTPYKSVRKTLTAYCSRKCNYSARYKRKVAGVRTI